MAMRPCLEEGVCPTFQELTRDLARSRWSRLAIRGYAPMVKSLGVRHKATTHNKPRIISEAAFSISATRLISYSWATPAAEPDLGHQLSSQSPSRTSKSRHQEISAHYYILVQPTASTVESNHPALILCYPGTHGTHPLRRHIPLIPRDMCVYPSTLSGLNYQFATTSNIWGRCSFGAVRWACATSTHSLLSY
jgi:hypothetical protein